MRAPPSRARCCSTTRGDKVIAFKKRRRKNSRRKRGYRHEFSLIRITEILTGGAKPSKEAKPRPKREPKPKPEAEAEARCRSGQTGQKAGQGQEAGRKKAGRKRQEKVR